MKKVLGFTLAAVLLVVVAAVSRTQGPGGKNDDPMKVAVEAQNPWTSLKLNNNPNEFRFAVVSDRTGGHRAQIFSKAIERLNYLQPEFVLSVGDLIEGYTEDKDKIETQWKEFDGFVRQLKMPFFYVPGNHDLTNSVQEKAWGARYGRSYYHFVYRDVLFLAVNSEDPPTKDSSKISATQIGYIKKALDENKGVRWTFVLLHKPLWVMAEMEKSGWPEVEKLLQGRRYTVFAGHVHRYQKFVRQGMNYYQLATTGGSSKMRGLRYGEFDHITWVTMKPEAPVIANVMLDGIFGDEMTVRDTEEPGVPTKNRKPVTPTNVRVVFDGKPAPNAVVVFHSYAEKTKKYSRVSDGATDSDGSVNLSTYAAFDGVPAGDYTVTITLQEPRWDATGKPGPHKLPLIYAKPETSPLRALVVENERKYLEFRLTP